jgi:DMSO/TMAO reductase YedYZ heme-binding membrane subunit
MPQGLRRRFWLESVLGSFTSVLAVITIFWHDWIETIFGVDPDKGSGTAEWLVVLALLTITSALAAAARVEWRRARLVRT